MIAAQNWVLLDRHKEERLEHEQWVERVDGNKVTFVESRLQPRDLEVLRYLRKLQILTSQQLAKLVFSKQEDGTLIKQPTVICNRRLKLLYKYGCVDRFFPATQDGKGASPAHYVLAKVGARILSLEGFRGIQVLSQRWRHTVAHNEVLVHYAMNHQLLKWKREMVLEWEHKYEKCKLMPDAFCIYVANQHEHFEMIEVDMGTEDIKVLHNKLKHYNLYLNSMECREATWQRHRDKGIFIKPCVSFYMNSPKRIKQLTQYISKAKLDIEVNVKSLADIEKGTH